MPSTCTLITKPITRSSAPPCSMCSGVITITATIAAWAPASPAIAAPSAGRVAHGLDDPAPRRAAGDGDGLGRELAGQQQRVGAQAARR